MDRVKYHFPLYVFQNPSILIFCIPSLSFTKLNKSLSLYKSSTLLIIATPSLWRSSLTLLWEISLCSKTTPSSIRWIGRLSLPSQLRTFSNQRRHRFFRWHFHLPFEFPEIVLQYFNIYLTILVNIYIPSVSEYKTSK